MRMASGLRSLKTFNAAPALVQRKDENQWVNTLSANVAASSSLGATVITQDALPVSVCGAYPISSVRLDPSGGLRSARRLRCVELKQLASASQQAHRLSQYQVNRLGSEIKSFNACAIQLKVSRVRLVASSACALGLS